MKKLGQDLKPGDIVILQKLPPMGYALDPAPPPPRWVRIVLLACSAKGASYQSFETCEISDEECRVSTRGVDFGHEYEVEGPELTPAQQHADELREMVWTCANFLRNGTQEQRHAEQRARVLLANIDPPKPPTLEEALELLRAIRTNGTPELEDKRSIDELLARVPK